MMRTRQCRFVNMEIGNRAMKIIVKMNQPCRQPQNRLHQSYSLKRNHLLLLVWCQNQNAMSMYSQSHLQIEIRLRDK